jgi:mono/diheme cytochrome c family protein
MSDLKNIFEKYWNKIKENPGTLFGILYPYILIIVVIIGLYYVANVGTVEINKIPAVVPDTTKLTDLAVVPARTVPPVNIFKMKVATPELLQKGKELYTTVCASCHNETGAGGGPASVGLNPAPRNFTSPDGWKNGRTLSAMYTTLEEGISGSAMISYNFLTPEERISVIQFIRTQFMQNPPEDTDEELAALNQIYNLSSGMEIPAQIPVSAAIEIIINEADQKIKMMNAVLVEIENDKSNQVEKLFDDVTDNNHLAVSALLNSDEWKTSESSFIDFLRLNVNQNGFNGRIFNLSDSEWNELYNYLTSLL